MLNQRPCSIGAVLTNQRTTWPALASNHLLQPSRIVAIDWRGTYPVFRLAADSNRGMADSLILFNPCQQLVAQWLIHCCSLLRTEMLRFR